MMPKISVVLPTYNGEKYIKESIDSILAQTFTDWELIIVDDCSSDSTYRIIEDYKKLDNRIKVIHNEINEKLPKSLNTGFRKAIGDYLTWTSDDNIYMPDAFKDMSEYLDVNSQVYMVRTDMYVIDRDSVILGEYYQFQPNELFVHDDVGACFMYRREVLETVGEYNPDLFCVEDYDYWLRIHETYGMIGRLPQKMYLYRQHEMSLTAQKKDLIDTQRTRMREQHFPYILMNLSGKKEWLTEIYCQMLESGFSKKKFPNELYSEVGLLKGDILKLTEGELISYGAGKYGDIAYKLVGDRIVYYIDSDPQKWGTLKNGIQVISIHDFMNKKLKYPILISVGPENVWGVLNTLHEYGINEFCTLGSLKQYLKEMITV